MRRPLTLLHRWLGLLIATFLLIAGLTGAIIAWDHELDAWLNPAFYTAKPTKNSSAEPSPPLAIAQQFESQHPELTVTFMPLALAAGETMTVMVSPRKVSMEDEPPALPYNQVALNPYTGEIQGKRLWGEVSLARENLLPFIYKLHYSLHLPTLSGVAIGTLFMGIIGIVWVVDCVIALSISFPSRSQWHKSFAFRWHSSRQKLTFDLHRSGGVWIWLLLLIMAVTSVSMNLGPQVVRPIVGWFSSLTPNQFELKNPENVISPNFNRETIAVLAADRARAISIDRPLGGIFYSSAINAYGVGFYAQGKEHGDVGLGNPWLYFDGKTGAYLGSSIPGRGSAGDIFMQAQFPLHSGRILGLAGRILVTCIGLMVAMLSVTGIIICARKRRSRALKSKNTHC